MPISPIDPPVPDPVSITPLIERRGELQLSPPLMPLTPLIGREAEVEAIAGLLLKPDTRLVTLIGPGGSGKTRLAVQVATDMQSNFRDGIAFAGLATVRDPSLVMAAIAESVGIRGPGNRSLRSLLRDREILVILDNVEHVLDAAPELAALLSACPHLTILATSRALLRISGEHVHRVPPLSVPDPERLPPLADLATTSAIALFTSRARAADPEFVLDERNAGAVVAICARLDGLPLAIELAAARSRVLTPPELLDRMDRSLDILGDGARDAPDRQRTMRATIAWSFDLLTPSARELVGQLAIFVGGFDLAGAEAVSGRAGDSLPGDLELLLDHGMLRRQDDVSGFRRFRMLETIREYALEQLVSSGEMAPIQRAHATYFTGLAERYKFADLHPDGDRAMALLETEHPNIRVALAWLEAVGDEPSVFLLATALGRFWSQHGHYQEGQRWLEHAVASENAAAPENRAIALAHLGMIEFYQGNHRIAESHLTEGLARSRQHNLMFSTALALLGLGVIVSARNDLDRGTSLLEDSLATARTIDDQPVSNVMSGLALGNLADIARARGDVELATLYSSEGLQLVREARHTVGMVLMLAQAGDLERDAGNLSRALDLYRQALAKGRELPGTRVAIEAIQSIGIVAIRAGHVERGTRLMGATEALRERIGLNYRTIEAQQSVEQAIDTARNQLGNSSFVAVWAAGQTMSWARVDAEAMARFEAMPDAVDPDHDVSTTRPSEPMTPARELLSPREVDVLRLLVTGQTDREIADMLFISHATARSHVSSILRKLDVNSRTAAATYAFQHGLV